MNKKILVLVLGLISTLNLRAEKIEGTIIFNNDSVNHVTLEIPVESFLFETDNHIDYGSLQEKIVYYNLDKKIKVKPNQVKEINFKFNGEDIRMISFNKNPYAFLEEPVLLRIIIDGKLKLFIYHSTRGPVGMYVGPGSKWKGKSGDIELILLNKNNDELFRPKFTDRGFKKDMRVYLSDCSSLLQKIENDLYNIDNIRQIVIDYNTNCASKE